MYYLSRRQRQDDEDRTAHDAHRFLTLASDGTGLSRSRITRHQPGPITADKASNHAPAGHRHGSGRSLGSVDGTNAGSDSERTASRGRGRSRSGQTTQEAAQGRMGS